MRKTKNAKRKAQSEELKTLSFTLIEILIYISVLAIILLAVSSFFIWVNRTNARSKAKIETLSGVREAMEVMAREIKEAEAVYAPTSVFSSTPGQLSLETKNYLPAGETSSYIDFYLCGERICFKKESQPPFAVTSERVEISDLVFNLVATASTAPSVQINVRADFKNPNNRPEFSVEVLATTTATLRAY